MVPAQNRDFLRGPRLYSPLKWHERQRGPFWGQGQKSRDFIGFLRLLHGQRYYPDNLLSFDAHALYFVRPLYFLLILSSVCINQPLFTQEVSVKTENLSCTSPVFDNLCFHSFFRSHFYTLCTIIILNCVLCVLQDIDGRTLNANTTGVPLLSV